MSYINVHVITRREIEDALALATQKAVSEYWRGLAMDAVNRLQNTFDQLERTGEVELHSGGEMLLLKVEKRPE